MAAFLTAGLVATALVLVLFAVAALVVWGVAGARGESFPTRRVSRVSAWDDAGNRRGRSDGAGGGGFGGSDGGCSDGGGGGGGDC